METVDGRLPGTSDMEIIHLMDAGQVCLNVKGASVITAA